MTKSLSCFLILLPPFSSSPPLGIIHSVIFCQREHNNNCWNKVVFGVENWYFISFFDLVFIFCFYIQFVNQIHAKKSFLQLDYVWVTLVLSFSNGILKFKEKLLLPPFYVKTDLIANIYFSVFTFSLFLLFFFS